MKRHARLMGIGILGGITLGILLDAWYTAGTTPVTYASDDVIELKEKVVLIGTSHKTMESREALVKRYFPNNWEEAIEVFSCESQMTHEIDGEVVEGPTQDFGLAQIHLPSHDARMKKLGYDIMDIEDNVEYASLLYKEQGWRPWVCARIVGLI